MTFNKCLCKQVTSAICHQPHIQKKNLSNSEKIKWSSDIFHKSDIFQSSLMKILNILFLTITTEFNLLCKVNKSY